MSLRDVAARLGVSTATLYRLVAKGQLAHVRVLNAVRVAPRDLEAFIEEGRRGGRGRTTRSSPISAWTTTR
jgi:excisionase family DNA binding protein